VLVLSGAVDHTRRALPARLTLVWPDRRLHGSVQAEALGESRASDPAPSKISPAAVPTGRSCPDSHARAVAIMCSPVAIAVDPKR
jgi:hypothetical protein